MRSGPSAAPAAWCCWSRRAERRGTARRRSLWVAAACLSIAINGSRGLPQYFVQANPALALAAAGAAVDAGRCSGAPDGRRAVGARASVALVVAVGVWRVNQFPKLVEQTLFDARYALGPDRPRRPTSRATATTGSTRRSAVDAAGRSIRRAHARRRDRVYVFGFTCAAYVEATGPARRGSSGAGR